MQQITRHLCLVLLFMANSALANVSSSGLVAYWPGTTGNDASVNNHYAYLQGGSAFQAGKYGMGFYFDGVNGHVRIEDSDAWHFADHDFTISFWLNPYAYNSEYTRVLTQWQWNGGSNRAWEMYIHNSKLTFSAKGAFSLTSNRAIALNQWQLITLVRENGVATLYIDGVADTSVTNAGAMMNNSATALLMGAVMDRDGVTAHAGDMFHGKMDEVRVYHRALNETEIDSLANPYPADPVSWQPEPNTTSHYYPAASNCDMEYEAVTPIAHAYRGSYKVQRGSTMSCVLPVNPGKFVERIVLDHNPHEMASKLCRVGFMHASYATTAQNTNAMTLTKDGGVVDVWVYEDLGSETGYNNGHPHNALVLTCYHEPFTGDSWIRYGVIRVDYAVE
ncbi:LamG domain-containing protein [Pseudoalteromonas rubra]|nr:LamG domain-containing protein [Pseudoalteromonas rubra]